MKFVLELLSPLCPAIGEGSAGIIDTEVAVDEFGIPEIPAKRLKGCLLECFDELAQYDAEIFSQNVRDRLFGRSGTLQGNVLIRNGRPSGYAELVDCLRHLRSNPTTASYFHPDAVRDVYTSIRTQTAVDRGTGAVKPKSLRSIRVIQPVSTFEFEVSFSGEYSLADLDILETCTNVLRHMGLNRTRGLGWVKCRLDRTIRENEDSGFFSTDRLDESETYELPLNLMLQSPVIFREGYVTGTALLGSFASLYIKDRKKQNPAYDPEKDELFADLFLHGKVRFRNGYPSVSDISPQRSRPNGAHWKRKKDDYDHVYIMEPAYDKNSNPSSSGTMQDDRMATVPQGFHIASPENSSVVYWVKQATEIHYHHQRPALKSIGHALGPESEIGGELFVYEALPRNSLFAAGLEGEGRLLNVLIDLAKRYGCLLRMGRSANVQYGQVRLKFGQIVRTKPPEMIRIQSGQTFGVLLSSPSVVPNSNGYCDCKAETFATAYLRELEKQLAGPLSIEPTGSVYCRFTEYSGYNTKWQLPKVSQPAYDGGSLFVFVNRSSVDVMVPARGTLGLYTSVGYGEYEIDVLAHKRLIVREPISRTENEIPEALPLTETTRMLISSVLKTVLFRRLSAQAAQDADEWFDSHLTHRDKLNPHIRKRWKLYRECRSKMNYETLYNQARSLDAKKRKNSVSFKDLFRAERVTGETDQILQELSFPALLEWKPGTYEVLTCYYDTFFAQLKVRLKRQQKEAQQIGSAN
ncbi:RAMP superfamily CRISPR-associated protein [Cohnella massiliensis]|uniref:RAMP superfamily CRISPR-associated protein n=1 Tax=Cohnella massiliensis TaxID=1816691 RepID=UPI0009BA2D13|nr:RAMP superfamily CRISPR-associated protein [Cohnella massiliensis]